ncbi:MAG TPA: BTAD domain-containing putative transcriptional regulator [Gaiellaceae bacterium]|nr:BTAD domain-containing putative transcriptional regulator [Gaiellaceae bacterium]
MTPRTVIRLFGQLSIENDSGRLGPADLGGTRPKQVLEILLAARGHRVTTDRLTELVWGDRRPQDAVGSLQTFVSSLRRHLDPDRDRARALVVTEPEAYRFATELVALDLDRFDELLEQSGGESTVRARRALEEALALVHGEVLEDEPYSTWAADLRGTYQGRVLGAHLEAADAALAELDFDAALRHTETAAALDRFSERAQRIAILALYALGRQHDALARYRAFRALLDEELGLEPTPETRAVEGAILRQEDVRQLLPRPIRGSDQRAGDVAIRLLGRTAELDTLTRAVQKGLEGGLTIVQIEGEAGLGKTRLLDEIATRLNGVRVGRASCSELERHLPYVPLAAALRDAVGGDEPDPRLPALARILPELSLETPMPEFDEVEVLEALAALVARHAPLVLLIDDLHRADGETIAALAYLRRRGGAVAGAVVTTRDIGQWSDLLDGLSPDTAVRLEPLSADDLAPLRMPELHKSSGGNPRFVAEVLADGQPNGPSTTLTEALLAQCRAEGPRLFRVLTSAALLEQPFAPEPLADILAAEPTSLTEELERLCERRILRVDGQGFRFRYELVRQALCESISPARRRLLEERLDQAIAAA